MSKDQVRPGVVREDVVAGIKSDALMVNSAQPVAGHIVVNDVRAELPDLVVGVAGFVLHHCRRRICEGDVTGALFWKQPEVCAH